MYPDFQAITRTIEIGGLAKADIVQKLRQQSISLKSMQRDY